jgi:hypothetical protein
MTQTLCPHCSGVLPTKAKAVKAQLSTPVDLSSLSDDQLFKYYKATAPIEDVRFFLRTQLTWSRTSDRAYAIYADATCIRATLEANRGKWTPVLKASWLSLKADWRRARNTDDRQQGVPAVGATRWTEDTEAA